MPRQSGRSLLHTAKVTINNWSVRVEWKILTSSNKAYHRSCCCIFPSHKQYGCIYWPATCPISHISVSTLIQLPLLIIHRLPIHVDWNMIVIWDWISDKVTAENLPANEYRYALYITDNGLEVSPVGCVIACAQLGNKALHIGSCARCQLQILIRRWFIFADVCMGNC